MDGVGLELGEGVADGEGFVVREVRVNARDRAGLQDGRAVGFLAGFDVDHEFRLGIRALCHVDSS